MILGPYPAVVVREHDGDTLDLDVLLKRRNLGYKAPLDLGFNVQARHDGIWLAAQSVRTFGDNAAELSTPAGKAALAYLQSLLPVGTAITLTSHGWDKYGGRCDGTILLPDGSDLVTAMVASGHAVVWDGIGVKPTGP